MTPQKEGPMAGYLPARRPRAFQKPGSVRCAVPASATSRPTRTNGPHSPAHVRLRRFARTCLLATALLAKALLASACGGGSHHHTTSSVFKPLPVPHSALGG